MSRCSNLWASPLISKNSIYQRINLNLINVNCSFRLPTATALSDDCESTHSSTICLSRSATAEEIQVKAATGRWVQHASSSCLGLQSSGLQTSVLRGPQKILKSYVSLKRFKSISKTIICFHQLK